MDFFEGWYQQQSPRDREIIRDLAMGETTADVAKKYGVSPGAVSQWRRKYAESWQKFIDPPEKTDIIDDLKDLNQHLRGNWQEQYQPLENNEQ
jgi:transposase-like protein